MKRFLLLLAVVAAGVVAAAFLVPSDAASVGGIGVSRASLDQQLGVIAASPGLQCFVSLVSVTESEEAAGSVPAVVVYGTGGPGTYSSSFAAQWLGRMVLDQAYQNLASRRGLTPTAAELASARRQLTTGVEGEVEELQQDGISLPAVCDQAGVGLWSAVPSWFTAGQVRAFALANLLSSHAAGYASGAAGERRFFADHRSSFDTLCAELLATGTRSAAAKVQREVNGGTQLSSVVASLGSGHSQRQCFSPSTTGYSTVAADTQGFSLGQAGAPLSEEESAGQAEYLVLVLTKRVPNTFAAVKAQVAEALESDGGSALQSQLEGTLAMSGVSVDARYGTWDATSFGVVPPIPPKRRFVLTPSADVAASTGTGPGAPASGTGAAAGTGSGTAAG